MSIKEPFKQTIIDDVSYVCPSWENMGEMTFLLAQEIIKSGQKFDRLVALAKGGWTWSRTLVDYLEIENMSSTRLKSYAGGVNSNGKVKVIQPLADSVDGERILLFDDVADSGNTLVKAKEYLELLGSKEVSTATLCFKPRSCFRPDYYAFFTKSWVVFPHDTHEFIKLSSIKWLAEGVLKKEIRFRFKEIGLPMNQVDYFLTKSGILLK